MTLPARRYSRRRSGISKDVTGGGYGAGGVPAAPSRSELGRRVLTSQRWSDLTFLHWPIDPTAVAAYFPPGVDPDVLDGVTYVGLVPFRMRRAGPGTVPVPYFGYFCETNVRLYSVDRSGRHGVVFLSLEADRLVTVLLARIGLGLPYVWSAMGIESDDVVMTYSSRRRWPGRRTGPADTIRVRIGTPTTATPTEQWLTQRWGLHTAVAGRTVWIPNAHGRWPLHSAELLELDSGAVAGHGLFPPQDPMLRPLWTPGVDTRFGRPRRVER